MISASCLASSSSPVAKLALDFEKNLLDGLDEADIENFDKVMDKLLARALKP